MAKKDKNAERNERRERMERMRREAQRAERRRTMTVVAVCVVIALAIVSVTGWQLYKDHQREQEIARTPLTDIGVGTDAAGCQDVQTKPAEGSQDHIAAPEPIPYVDAPPAFGPHRPDPAEFARKFYSAEDRPEVATLVHNEEHGYTVLWYDQTVADDAEQLQTVEDLAARFDIGDMQVSSEEDLQEYNANKFLAVPWNVGDEDDGMPFPDDAHVALTRWLAEGDDAAGEQGEGVWLYCDQPSGAVLEQFMKDYPQSNSIEPSGL